ncbi:MULTISPECIES: TonB-dependent receptor [Pseudoalteromonas]|uniref:Ligand-gated channel protein n=1 Tax=Pseudoalteromonas amylolytica TaxID=1859457 RepID=A0A1S1MZ92_9GAMM|nr:MULTISPECIES: TonB-dependent receptor [Pseudoalteromonas]OHU88044.1 ligand-gated channel protein [Pseudoalteromonas sp. JW3]OHU91484.1 ligand-gated channel protein [Pseudoalteromonas amylolytica]
MIKQSLISSAIVSALFSTYAIAGDVKGKVVDHNNQPVSGAKVHLHGKTQSVTSDKNGQFTIAVDADSQLHVTKNNYIDERINITEDNGFVTVQLKPSAVESIVVFASALHKNNVEMASPVSVLGGDELKNAAKPTLGETLKGIPGINASYFGPVSSSPIIRGLDGPRVKITQNGLDSSDASRVGPDHANTNDSLSAQQIEVLRGPATLLYGSGAIGGVVNVVDNRIPSDVIESLNGAAEYSHDSVSNTNTYAALLETGKDGFNFHFDGVKRKGGDYETPSFELPSEEHEEHGEHDEHEDHADHAQESHDEHAELANRVENTFIDSQQVNFGTSYINEHVTVGLSFGRIDTDYGIPGHSHAHHEEHDHEEAHAEDDHDMNVDEGHDEHDDENVFARVKQDRWQALFNYALHDQWIEAISVRAGYTDYTHSEIEGGEVGTTFSNKSSELRANVEHKFGQWHGILGYHYSDSDYAAQGEEAFTPATTTKSHAVYLLEERTFGDFTLELGARIEDYQLSSHIIEAEHHEHDSHDEEHHDDHDEDVHAMTEIDYQLDITNISASVGGVYHFQDGHNVAVNVSRSERAPLTAELLANGIHIATGTYELGLGYHIEDGEVHFEPEDIKQETATNIDLSLRRFIGDFGYTINVFYNDIDNYYYQQSTGLIFSEAHGIEVADHEHENALPVFQFRSNDAELYGIELDAHYNINDKNRVKVFADKLSAKLKNGNPLPRIPSDKLGVKYEFDYDGFKTNMTVTRYAKQDDITAYETTTSGYTIVDASVQYDFSHSGIDFVGYLNLDNLTDELGFVHSSFIKEQAPLPGRNVKLGIRAYF